MMGYDVDFGHKQAADLIPSNNFEEKQVGYQALTILLNEVSSQPSPCTRRLFNSSPYSVPNPRV